MTDHMRPMPFAGLLTWVREEHARHGSVFGIARERFYRPPAAGPATAYGRPCAVPLGPAAGPHTQLAQNIAAAYLCGARVFELKTVQVLDELAIDKPCIEAADECYNTEWSTELRIEDACTEYIHAWTLLHLLQALTGGGDAPDFVFNLSVGYDLDGVTSPKVDGFVNALIDASGHPAYESSTALLADALASGLAGELGVERPAVPEITPRVCSSAALSTMHGCPAEQIGQLCTHLMEAKGLDVYAKLNPTLLGHEDVRSILDQCGFGSVALRRESFAHDLQYDDARALVKDMQARAAVSGRLFGVKLSNTLAVVNTRGALPGDEMYMSGRALYPLTVELAARLAESFDGALAVSFSGGASQANVAALVEAGVVPVTLATDLLKPGGYYRLAQLAAQLETLSNWPDGRRVDPALLAECATDARSNPAYQRAQRADGQVAVDGTLPLFDCYIAPCVAACPINQDVPEYARLVHEGRYFDALELIYARNPLPHITGHICDHACEYACTRWDYEQPVCIRDLKRIAAEHGYSVLRHSITAETHDDAPRVAVVGAGPSGLAAAAFLARVGMAVTVFDREDQPGGIVQHVIPSFRLPQEAIDHDVELVRRLGVTFELGCDQDPSVADLRAQGFEYIYLAIGAGTSIELPLEGDNPNTCAAIDFLWQCKGNTQVVTLGPSVAVVGGGNSAMDAARAAKRAEDVERVYLLYRRTQAEMPADREEFENAVHDGVEFRELRQPTGYYQDGRLVCQVMELGEPDASGRRRPVPVAGQEEVLRVDALIAAIGEGVDEAYLAANALAKGTGRVVQADSETHETNIANVFAGGDMRQGPASVVRAIADARRVADEIIGRAGLAPLTAPAPMVDAGAMAAHTCAIRGCIEEAEPSPDGTREAGRCLSCNVVCEKCVDVCPNRANIAVPTATGTAGMRQRAQILHVDAWCNECGNCETFCPYDGAPYLEKFTLYACEADFAEGRNPGFFVQPNGAELLCTVRVGGTVRRGVILDTPAGDEEGAWRSALAMVRAVRDEYPWLLCVEPYPTDPTDQSAL
jgi:putative selenate reductase